MASSRNGFMIESLKNKHNFSDILPSSSHNYQKQNLSPFDFFTPS